MAGDFEFEQGDRVRFERAHKSQNPVLQGHRGEEGIVRATIPEQGKVLVQFERSDMNYGRWWIQATRLVNLSAPERAAEAGQDEPGFGKAAP